MNDTVSLRIQLIYTIRILYNSIGEAKSNQSRPSDNFFFHLYTDTHKTELTQALLATSTCFPIRYQIYEL